SSVALCGRGNLRRMLGVLEEIQPSGPTHLAAGIKNFCLRNPGQGVVVLLSDLLDKQGYAEGLRYLTARRMDPYVIQILSEEELNPELQGDLQLVDCEDQDQTEITVSAPLLKRYRQTLDSFVGSAREYCARRGIGYWLANNQFPFEQLVTGYLRQRGLVR